MNLHNRYDDWRRQDFVIHQVLTSRKGHFVICGRCNILNVNFFRARMTNGNNNRVYAIYLQFYQQYRNAIFAILFSLLFDTYVEVPLQPSPDKIQWTHSCSIIDTGM